MRTLLWLGVLLALAGGVDDGWISDLVMGFALGATCGWMGRIVWQRERLEG